MDQTHLSQSPRRIVQLVDAPKHRPWTTRRWLRNVIYTDRLPYHKIGGRIFIDLADLDALVEAGRIEPT